MALDSSDLELVMDGSKTQVVGMRFRMLPLPNGSILKNAHIQFTADEVDAETTNLIIQAESVDDSALLTTLDGSLSSRTTTLPSATLSPDAWRTPGEASETQKSLDPATVMKEIVQRPGWVSGNALSIIISARKPVPLSWNR